MVSRRYDLDVIERPVEVLHEREGGPPRPWTGRQLRVGRWKRRIASRHGRCPLYDAIMLMTLRSRLGAAELFPDPCENSSHLGRPT